MEAVMLIRALTILLLAVAALYLLLLRPWRLQRLYHGRVPSVDGLFVVGLALGLAASLLAEGGDMADLGAPAPSSLRRR